MSSSPKKSNLPRNLTEAVHDTVHEFGVEALAQLTGQSPGVIYNKVNPNPTTAHQPTLADAMVWQALTKDFRILQAMANALGYAAVPLPNLTNVSDAALLEHLARIGKEGGDFHCALSKALKDKRFSLRDAERIEAEGFEWIAAILEACSRIRGLVDE